MVLAASAAALLVGCGVEDPASGGPSSRADNPALPFAHVHGVGVDPADGTVLVATHEGLFRVDAAGQAEQVSPVMDLMGFAVAGPGHFVASGHPGPDVDLPQPVGLIESTDAGRTWRPVSRQGKSDFHALAVGDAGFIGFDGTLLRSSDGQDWTTLQIPMPPASLTASPETPDVLATTQAGVLRSTDGGSSWEPVSGAPVLQVVDWADVGASVVGVDPGGVVWTSQDSGTNWVKGPALGAPPQAVTAADGGPAGQRIVVATTTAVLASDDGGRTFDALVAN